MNDAISKIPDYNYRQTVEGLEFGDWKDLGEFYESISQEDTDVSGPERLTYNFETEYGAEIFASWDSNTVELMGSKNMVNYSINMLESDFENAAEKEAHRYNFFHKPVIRHFAGLFDY